MRFWPLLVLLLFFAYWHYGGHLPDLERFSHPVVAVLAPAAPRRSNSSTFVPNYLSGPHMQAPRRWRGFPVRVYFETGGAYSAGRRDAAVEGFSSWSTASGGVLRHTVVDTASKADVTVRFISGAYVPPSRSTVGLTRSLSSGEWLRSAQITLATGGRTTLGNITDVAAHEWGHALGINGHSDDPKDLMSSTSVRIITITPFGRLLHSESRVRTPTSRDLNTMKTIYADRFQPSGRR